MKISSIFLAANLMLSLGGCSSGVRNVSTANAPIRVAEPASTPMPTPKNGDHPGTGKVTKINNELGSVELDHKEIVGVMPPMVMEFFVTDKAMLKGLNIGDEVEFLLRYKDGQETVSKIEKVK